MTADEWDARATLDIGMLIERYLSERPPPCETLTSAAWTTWSAQLKERGEDRLATLGSRRLAPVGAGA